MQSSHAKQQRKDYVYVPQLPLENTSPDVLGIAHVMIGYGGAYIMIKDDKNYAQSCHCETAKQEPCPPFEPCFMQQHHLRSRTISRNSSRKLIGATSTTTAWTSWARST